MLELCKMTSPDICTVPISTHYNTIQYVALLGTNLIKVLRHRGLMEQSTPAIAGSDLTRPLL